MTELINYFLYKIKRDEVALQASALSFTTILALIPAITIVVSVFAMVPAFKTIKSELEVFVKENFMPVFTDALSENIANFVEHAGSLTITSTIILVIVSLMLIRAVDKALNRIWKGGRRSVAITFAIYWTLLTVGPLVLGVLLYLSSQLIAQSLNYKEIAIFYQFLYVLMPIIIEIGILTTLFLTVPVAPVHKKDAICGAIFTTIAFEISKKVFAIFILNFSDYEAIYGALAALPVLMIWIYINWWIILLGAELTSSFGLVRQGHSYGIPRYITYFVSLTGKSSGSFEVENTKKALHKRIIVKVSPSNKA